MEVKILIVGCDYIWLGLGTQKLLYEMRWYSINADVEKRTVKEWFPGAFFMDYGSPNLSKHHKEGIDKSMPLTKKLAESLFIKGTKRKSEFMALF